MPTQGRPPRDRRFWSHLRPNTERIFEHHDGYTLPGAAPLEKFMRELGVSPKQTGRARQAFMRSARQAGFFRACENRLVRPSFPAGGPARDRSMVGVRTT